MLRGSSKLTAIYFFSSIRANSGKSTVVSNLSIYLNSLSNKVAIIDLDFISPKKLRLSFPQSCEIEEYSELSDLIQSEAPRFKQNFYFTNPNKISFFNAHGIKSLYDLMTDTAFRDFFILLNNTFDYVLVNLTPGTSQSVAVSDILSKSYLWRGYKPASIIISLSDEKSIIDLDSFIQNNQIVNYQAEENTYFIFNKVPNSIDIQELDEPKLNSVEIRKIFTYPFIYTIPFIDEFIEQKNNVNPYVLQNDTVINQHILSITKVLNGYAPISYLKHEANIYQSCISGSLLSQIYPYLEKLQQKVAKKLFIDSSDVNIYVEQNDENFRIRVRLGSYGQKLLGIRSDIPEYQKLKISNGKNPNLFKFGTLKGKLKAFNQISRETPYSLSFKSIFSFNDNFYFEPEKEVRKTLPIDIIHPPYLSPTSFEYKNRISEIPTLSNILGLDKNQKFVKYYDSIEKINLQEVNPVYIPIEFPLLVKLKAKNNLSFQRYNSFIIPPLTWKIDIAPVKRFDFSNKNFESYKLFDFVATNFSHQFTSDFSIKNIRNCHSLKGILSLPYWKFSLLSDKLIDSKNTFIIIQPNNPVISDKSISKFKLIYQSESKFENKAVWFNTCKKTIIKSPIKYELNYISLKKYDFNLKKYEFTNSFYIPKLYIIAKIYNIYNDEPSPISLKTFKSERKISDFTIINYSPNTFKPEFLNRLFKHLPKSFSFNDVLMDYNYTTNISKKIKTKFLSDENITKNVEFKPQIRYKISNTYMEPELTMKTTYKKPIMYQLFNLGKLRVTKKVLVSSIDYKVAYNDIFHCGDFKKSSEHTKEKEYKLPQTLELKDITNNERNLFILRIKEFIVDKKNKSPFKDELPFATQRPLTFLNLVYDAFKINLRVCSISKPGPIKNDLKYFKLSLFNFDRYSKHNLEDNFELKDDSILNFDATFNSEIESPEIYTENIRLKNEKFFSYKLKSPTLNIISNKTIFKETICFKLQFLNHDNLPTTLDGFKNTKESKHILISRAVKLINNFTDLNNYNPKFYDFTYTLKDKKLSLLEEEFKSCDFYSNKMQYKPYYPDYKPELKYILKKNALKKPSLNKFSRAIFVISHEEALDLLINHFIWQSKNAYGPIVCEYNETLTTKRISKYNKWFRESFILKPIFSNKIDFCFQRSNYLMKINKTFARIPYKIKNRDMLKDLLAYARSMSTSLSETQKNNRN